MNEATIKNYLNLLNQYGVPTIECRVFPALNNVTKPINKKFSTHSDQMDVLFSFIKTNGLEKGTINATFNVIKDESLSKDKAIKDSDIESVRFIFIDIDCEKEKSDSSATKEELNLARGVENKVSQFLTENGLNEQIHIFSGNGFHIMLPIQMTNTKETNATIKQFLTILAAKFNNDKVKIDTSVSNPGRLNKLVGTLAAKGETTKERPHRVSTLIGVPDAVTFNSLDQLKKIAEKYEGHEQTTSLAKREKTSYVIGNAVNWLNHYDIGYREKKGDNGHTQIYVLDKCPLAEHSTNQNGASLIANGNSLSFKCLHESHEHKTIHDFATFYPLPNGHSEGDKEVVNLVDLKAGKEYYFDNFMLKNDGLYQISKDGNIRIASALFMEKIYANYHTKKVKYRLQFNANNRWTHLIIDGETLQVSKLRGLTAYGVEIKSRSEPEVADFLTSQKKGLDPIYYHESLGWEIRNDELVYLLEKTYPYPDANPILTEKSPDAYYNLEKRGSYDSWHKGIQQYVGGKAIDLCLGIAFVALIIGFLKTNPVRPQSINNLIINLKGRSSSGKTTMMDVISSTGGPPDELILSLNATQNALTKLASMNVGFPLLLDELGTQATLSFNQFIFQISSGIERLRLNSDSEIKKQERFSTGVITTSEQPLDTYFEHTAGLFVRYLEFEDINWTADAAESDALKQLSREHFGHAMPKLVEQLFLKEKSYLLDLYDQTRSMFNAKITDPSPFKNRIIDNISLVYTGSAMVKELLELDIQLDYVKGELINLYEKMESLAQPQEKDEFEMVKEWLISRGSQFISKDSATKNYSNKLGRVAIVKGELRVNIFKNAFEEMIRKVSGVTNPQSIIKTLIDKGKLNTEKGRRTKRLVLSNQSISTYEIVLPLELKGYFNLSDEFNHTNSLPQINSQFSLSEPSSQEGLLTDDLSF